MQIKLNNITLAKGSAQRESPFDVIIDGQSQFQIFRPLRAKEIQTFDRGNLKTALSFRVNRQHASQPEAMTHALTHAATLVNVAGTVTLSFTEGATEHKYALSQAVVREVKSTFQSNTSSHQYSLIGGTITKVEG